MVKIRGEWSTYEAMNAFTVMQLSSTLAVEPANIKSDL